LVFMMSFRFDVPGHLGVPALFLAGRGLPAGGAVSRY
jgi:hypothetical protein